jgi:hypothetical protein
MYERSNSDKYVNVRVNNQSRRRRRRRKRNQMNPLTILDFNIKLCVMNSCCVKSTHVNYSLLISNIKTGKRSVVFTFNFEKENKEEEEKE